MMKKPKDLAATLRNLDKDIWKGIDPVQYPQQAPSPRSYLN